MAFSNPIRNTSAAETEFELTTRLPLAERHFERALGYVNADNLEKALGECEIAIQIMPQYALLHHYRGMILEERERLEEAIAAYHEAVRLAPEFYPAREYLFLPGVSGRKRNTCSFHGISQELLKVMPFSNFLRKRVKEGASSLSMISRISAQGRIFIHHSLHCIWMKRLFTYVVGLGIEFARAAAAMTHLTRISRQHTWEV